MWSRYSTALILGSLIFQNAGLSQERVDDAVVQPLARTRVPTLADLVQAKLDPNDGMPRLIVMVEAFRTEKRMAKRTMMRVENRKRVVNDEQGNPVEREFQVAVPVTEEVEIDTKIPAGRKPVDLPAADLQFFNTQGEEVAIAAVAEQLSSLQPVFLIDGAEGELPPLPNLWQQVLREDCLIVVTHKQIRERPVQLPMLPLAPAANFLQPAPAAVVPVPAALEKL